MAMIRVTRKSGEPVVVNADLIKFIEETPDTILTLRDGEKMLVQESAEILVNRAVEYQRLIRFWPDENR
jgi:flagellar protein FlbD